MDTRPWPAPTARRRPSHVLGERRHLRRAVVQAGRRVDLHRRGCSAAQVSSGEGAAARAERKPANNQHSRKTLAQSSRRSVRVRMPIRSTPTVITTSRIPRTATSRSSAMRVRLCRRRAGLTRPRVLPRSAALVPVLVRRPLVASQAGRLVPALRAAGADAGGLEGVPAVSAAGRAQPAVTLLRLPCAPRTANPEEVRFEDTRVDARSMTIAREGDAGGGYERRHGGKGSDRVQGRFRIGSE